MFSNCFKICFFIGFLKLRSCSNNSAVILLLKDVYKITACPICLYSFLLVIHSYVFRLHKTQDLLYESTQDTLKMRQAWTENELRWRSEKNKLMMQLTDLRGRLNGGDFEDTDYEPAKQTTNNSHITLKIDNSAKYRAEAKVCLLLLRFYYFCRFYAQIC